MPRNDGQSDSDAKRESSAGMSAAGPATSTEDQATENLYGWEPGPVPLERNAPGHDWRCKCPECKRARNALERERYKDGGKQRMRATHLKRTYGITAQHYDHMAAKQQYLCAICGQPERRKRANGEPFELAVDHDHDTGRIRSLLCSDCNQAIGFMADDPGRLEAAANYIRRHQANSTQTAASAYPAGESPLYIPVGRQPAACDNTQLTLIDLEVQGTDPPSASAQQAVRCDNT